jgi:SAM-dependent methyltransferase
MSVNGNGRHVAPALLAEAMRAGLEARYHPAPHPHAGAEVVTPLPELLPALRGYAGLLHHPPVVKPGRLAPVFRFLRRALRALLRPWFEFQTRYNELALDQLDTYRAQVNDNLARLDKRLRELGQHLDRCEQRLDDKAYYTEYVNRELSDRGKIAQAGLWLDPPVSVQLHGGEPRLVAVTPRIVEHIFAHTRLPRPPARALALGCAATTNALEMASLGFEVVGVDIRPLPLAHPNFRMVSADPGQLPLPDDSFDVAVSLSAVGNETDDRGAIAEVRRVLKPGGRLISSVPFGLPIVTPTHRVYDRAALDELLASFRLVEATFAVRDGDSWYCTADDDQAGRADSARRVSAVALVVAEKP